MEIPQDLVRLLSIAVRDAVWYKDSVGSLCCHVRAMTEGCKISSNAGGMRGRGYGSVKTMSGSNSRE
jgi:hypothetical protein